MQGLITLTFSINIYCMMMTTTMTTTIICSLHYVPNHPFGLHTVSVWHPSTRPSRLINSILIITLINKVITSNQQVDQMCIILYQHMWYKQYVIQMFSVKYKTFYDKLCTQFISTYHLSVTGTTCNHVTTQDTKIMQKKD